MKKFLCSILVLLPLCAFAELKDNKDNTKPDTLYTELRSDIVILTSTKETNSLKSLPAAVSIFSPKNLEATQVKSIKDLSAIVPNFFMPNYGSKMTSPLYIRGIGARTGVQTVSLYVDNIPYFNTSSFDNELYDIQRIEVLKGTQGTLYGRNSMGGIINIYTFSSISYEGTNASIGGGNHGLFSTTLSHYQRLGNNKGIAISGYYKKDDGFFKNVYKNENADKSESAGTRVKFDWQVNPKLFVQYSGNFDFVNQGAFPYMLANANNVNLDEESNYKRRIITNGVSIQYTQPKYVISSVTGYQYLIDDMNMDQDYTPAAIFRINQQQQQNSINQEFTIKSKSKSDYQWSNGVFGFYDYQKIISPVTLLQDGIKSMLQYGLDQAAQNPNVPIIKITDQAIGLDGVYRKPAYGGALFHQSTFNNILETKGLSFTLGLRLDYEKTELDYDAQTGTNLTMQQQNPQGSPIIPLHVDSIIKGKTSNHYMELLPKFVLKYEITPKSYVYASASRGYKTGGHNVQSFADLLSGALQASIMRSKAGTPNINDIISFDPEYSWNYEIGGNIDIISNTLATSFAVYYMDIKDVQISQFVKSYQGRVTTNAGKAVSKGFEIGFKLKPCTGFYLYANYGFADARFKEFKDDKGDYFNKHITFAPSQTATFGTNVSYRFKKITFLDRISFDANFSGAGRMYWTELNDKYQPFYGTVNSRISIEKSFFELEIWGKNIFDREYNSFYFESMGNSFIQKGKPSQWGATLRVKL